MSTNLYKKLFDLRKEIGSVSKDSQNPFFKSKYFDINKLLEHVQPLLDKNNLLLLQPIREGSVYTQIIDIEDGRCIESGMQLPVLSDPQKMGSAVTYYRRYTLQSLLGIQAEDDDGNRASSNTPVKKDLPWLNEGSNEWKGLTAALSREPESVTLEKIQKKYRLSEKTKSSVISLLEEALI